MVVVEVVVVVEVGVVVVVGVQNVVESVAVVVEEMTVFVGAQAWKTD